MYDYFIYTIKIEYISLHYHTAWKISHQIIHPSCYIFSYCPRGMRHMGLRLQKFAFRRAHASYGWYGRAWHFRYADQRSMHEIDYHASPRHPSLIFLLYKQEDENEYNDRFEMIHLYKKNWTCLSSKKLEYEIIFSVHITFVSQLSSCHICWRLFRLLRMVTRKL